MLAPTTEQAKPTLRPGRKRLVRRVLQADPGQEYLVYVPATISEKPPLFVSVHGMSRNADQHARLLAGYCDIYGAILVAPIFTAEEHPDFQRLGRVGRGKRADIALNLIVAEVSAMTPASGERFYLFGFSGGAQFAHRYLMANPHRVAAAVVAGAGWYTFPDATRRFPFGTRISNKLPDVRFDAEEFLSVPVTVMVGTKDSTKSGFRRSARLDGDQGVTRIARARNWVSAMKASAEAHHLESRVSFQKISNGTHSFKQSILAAGLGEKVFCALFGPPPVAPNHE
ncbi:MAG: PHB depolymerase family esterase [Gammaproteobacteria bacterium]